MQRVSRGRLGAMVLRGFVVVLLWCVAADVNQSCFHAQLVKGAYNGGS